MSIYIYVYIYILYHYIYIYMYILSIQMNNMFTGLAYFDRQCTTDCYPAQPKQSPFWASSLLRGPICDFLCR